MSDQVIKTLIVLAALLAVAGTVAVFAYNLVKDRALNAALGIMTLTLAALVGIYFTVKPMLTQAEDPPRRYIAYFENAAGIQKGDVVRMKGRRAGRVTDAMVVNKDGKVMVRVEFEIAPGSGSTWLKEGEIPHDSIVRVRPPGIVGRPSLMIEFGKDEQRSIADGGEWKHAQGESGETRIERLRNELKRFDAAVEKFIAIVGNEAMIREIKAQAAQIRAALRDAEKSAARGAARAAEFDQQLDAIASALKDLNDSLEKNSASITSNISRLSEGTAEAPKTVANFSEQISKYGESIAKFRNTVASLEKQVSRDDLGKVLKEFRKFAATIRASAEMASLNPKNAGDMPPWRFARPFFNGGRQPLERADLAEKAAAIPYKELPAAPKDKPKTLESSGD